METRRDDRLGPCPRCFGELRLALAIVGPLPYCPECGWIMHMWAFAAKPAEPEAKEAETWRDRPPLL